MSSPRKTLQSLSTNRPVKRQKTNSTGFKEVNVIGYDETDEMDDDQEVPEDDGDTAEGSSTSTDALQDLRKRFLETASKAISRLFTSDQERTLLVDANPHIAFARFKASAHSVSDNADRDLLVAPSGRLNAELGFLLHWPSFSTTGPLEKQ